MVVFFSPNHADYVVASWAFHRLGAVVACVFLRTFAVQVYLSRSTANPMYTVEELINLLNLCKATRIVTDEYFLGAVGAAAAYHQLQPFSSTHSAAT
ncbi:hypothetical protein C8R44DRAFT_121459 [Mycena epipterygia]|nr:hypothetical protein C8R44DRAFT_121459 [Mycena epipterygia]